MGIDPAESMALYKKTATSEMSSSMKISNEVEDSDSQFEQRQDPPSEAEPAEGSENEITVQNGYHKSKAKGQTLTSKTEKVIADVSSVIFVLLLNNFAHRHYRYRS